MRCLALVGLVSSLAVSVAASELSTQDILGSYPSENSNEPAVDPCTLVDSPKANASVQLSSWLECAVNSFYPYPANTNWSQGHATSFSKDIKFAFNDTRYDFNGSLRLYKTFNATLGVAFAPFKHGFINVLGVPNANGDKGGFVYMIGWAGGFQTRAKRDMYFTNAAFAVVKEEEGERKIVEFRESSNIPNTAHLPEPVQWECGFE